MKNTNYRNKKRIKGKMNEEKCTGKINKLAFWPAVIALIAFIVAGIVDCQRVGNEMSKILNIIANYFGAYINILVTAVFDISSSDHYRKVWRCDHWRKGC